MPGVTLTGLPGSPVTDAHGSYSANVPHGWSGTITPDALGYRFTPASLTVGGVDADLGGQSFTAAKVGSVRRELHSLPNRGSREP